MPRKQFLQERVSYTHIVTALNFVSGAAKEGSCHSGCLKRGRCCQGQNMIYYFATDTSGELQGRFIT